MFKEWFLSFPIGYQLFQLACGAEKMRKILTQEYIRPCTDSSILDIGCGTADIRPYLGNAVSYTGIDLSKSYIEHNRSKYSRDPSTVFICKDLKDYARCSPSYDTILLMGILHHIDDKTVCELLSLLPQLLRPNGRIVTMDGCYTNNLTSFEKMLLRNDRGKFVRSLPEWNTLFSECLPEATYEIRKDLYYLPFNVILFQYQLPQF